MDSTFREEMLTEQLRKRYEVLCEKFEPGTVLPPYPQLVKSLSDSSRPSGLSAGIDDLGKWVDNTVSTYEFVCTLWQNPEWRTVITTLVEMNGEDGFRALSPKIEKSTPRRRTAGSYPALQLVDTAHSM